MAWSTACTRCPSATQQELAVESSGMPAVLALSSSDIHMHSCREVILFYAQDIERSRSDSA